MCRPRGDHLAGRAQPIRSEGGMESHPLGCLQNLDCGIERGQVSWEPGRTGMEIYTQQAEFQGASNRQLLAD